MFLFHVFSKIQVAVLLYFCQIIVYSMWSSGECFPKNGSKHIILLYFSGLFDMTI